MQFRPMLKEAAGETPHTWNNSSDKTADMPKQPGNELDQKDSVEIQGNV